MVGEKLVVILECHPPRTTTWFYKVVVFEDTGERVRKRTEFPKATSVENAVNNVSPEMKAELKSELAIAAEDARDWIRRRKK